jgi:hypothetical protein
MGAIPRPVTMLIAAGLSIGCGSKEPPQAESPANAAPQATATAAAEDPNRALTRKECEALGQSIVDACNNRGNDRSSEVDGWCSDMLVRAAEDGSWLRADCKPHFKYLDAVCFHEADNVRSMIGCDKTVDRSK